MNKLNPIHQNPQQLQESATERTTEAVLATGEALNQSLQNKATSQDIQGSTAELSSKLDDVSRVTQEANPNERLDQIIQNTAPKPKEVQEIKLAQPPKDIANAFFSMLVPKKGEDYYTKEEAQDFLKKATPIKGVHYRDGHDPVLGEDYLTDDDIAEIKDSITPRKGADYFTKKEVDEIKTSVRPVKGKDYNDGKDADEKKIVGEVLSQIKLPEYKETVLDNGEQIAEKLNSLKNVLNFEVLTNIPDFAMARDVVGYRGGGGGGGQVITFQDEGTAITTNPINTFNVVGSTGALTYSGNGVATLTLTAVSSFTLAQVSASSTTTANSLYTMTSAVPVEFQSSATGATIYLTQANASADSFDLNFRKARGDGTTPTVITSGDELGVINFAGYGGAAGYITGAAIKAITAGTMGDNRVPAQLSFWTGTDASPTVLTQRMTILQGGNVGIGTVNPVRLFDIHGGTGDVYFMLHNNNSGSAITDGFEFALGTDGNVNAWNWENGYIRWATNAIERMRIAADGNVRVNGFASTVVGLTVKAAASQSVDIQQWESSAAVAVAGITSAGSVISYNSYTDANNYSGLVLANDSAYWTAPGLYFKTAGTGTPVAWYIGNNSGSGPFIGFGASGAGTGGTLGFNGSACVEWNAQNTYLRPAADGLTELGTSALRWEKTWTVDLESTNMPTVGGTAILTSLTAPQFTTIELGHASDTTLARVSAGVVSIEGVNILTVAGGTLTGNIQMGENTNILLDAALSADGKYSAIESQTGTLGETVAFGEFVYLKAADSQWYKTDADAASTAGSVMVGVCVVTGNDNDSTTIMFKGNIRADSLFPTFTIGAPVYLSTTPGAVTNTAPSGTDDVVRVVGFGKTGDELFVDVSGDYATIV